MGIDILLRISTLQGSIPRKYVIILQNIAQIICQCCCNFKAAIRKPRMHYHASRTACHAACDEVSIAGERVASRNAYQLASCIASWQSFQVLSPNPAYVTET